MNSLTHPRLSVVIPVYNEEEGLQALFDRLYPALDHVASQYALSYELVLSTMVAKIGLLQCSPCNTKSGPM